MRPLPQWICILILVLSSVLVSVDVSLPFAYPDTMSTLTTVEILTANRWIVVHLEHMSRQRCQWPSVSTVSIDFLLPSIASAILLSFRETFPSNNAATNFLEIPSRRNFQPFLSATDFLRIYYFYSLKIPLRRASEDNCLFSVRFWRTILRFRSFSWPIFVFTQNVLDSFLLDFIHRCFFFLPEGYNATTDFVQPSVRRYNILESHGLLFQPSHYHRVYDLPKHLWHLIPKTNVSNPWNISEGVSYRVIGRYYALNTPQCSCRFSIWWSIEITRFSIVRFFQNKNSSSSRSSVFSAKILRKPWQILATWAKYNETFLPKHVR